MNIKEIELGFPVFRNYTVDITENQEILDGWMESQMSDKTERNVKLLLSCTAEQKKNIPYQTISAALRKNNAIKSVKVVYDVKDSAHVRAPEIIRAKTQAEKLSEYIKVNKLKASDTVYSKLKEIEDSLSIKYAAPHHTFTLLEVNLRGSIGIKEGTGKEEITLDFTKYANGLVALTGTNGSGKCIVGDSTIITQKGFVNINSFDNETIKEGFNSYKENVFLKNDFVQTSHFYKEKVKNTIKIYNSLGMSLEGTYEHPVLTFDRNCDFVFKKLKDITTDDYVCIPRGMATYAEKEFVFAYKVPQYRKGTKSYKLPKENSPELSRLIGYFIANGVFSKNGVEISSLNLDIINDIKEISVNLFGFSSPALYKSKNCYNLVIQSVYIRDFLKYVIGDSSCARYKKIPLCILNGTRNDHINFLRSLFDCDSYFNENYLELVTASEDIAKNVQLILLNLGIISTVTNKKVKNYSWIYKKVSISGINSALAWDIIFSGKSKKYNNNVVSRNSNPGKNIIPFLNNYIRENIKFNKEGFYIENGTKYKNSLIPVAKGREISYDYLSKMIVNHIDNGSLIDKYIFRKICKIRKNNYFFSKIRSVEYINEPKWVFDFTIPNEHSFFSNGFISHNTTCIENCHPYLRMLTRGSKLQDHFFLRDSYRELLYVDEGGIYYRIRIDIDGKNKSGKVKAFAFTGEDPENLNPVDGLDGNVDQYNEWVVNTFGSIELFLRTVFYTKGNTGSVTDIASATKGEKKSFFNSLLGTESASEISAASREKSKELKAKITEKETLIDDSDYDAMIKEVLTHGKEVDKRIKVLRDEIKKLNAELDGLKKTDSGTDVDSKIREKESQLLETKGLLATYTSKKENFGKYEKIKPLLEKADSIRNRISERQPLLDANREEVRSLEAKEKEAYTNLADAKADVTAKNNLVTDIADTCPTCGQKLPAEKVAELEKQAVKNRKALEKAESKLLAAQEAHDLIAKELADTNRGVKWLERENEKDEKEISELGIPDEASLLKMEAESTDLNALNEYLSVYTKKTSTLEKELSQLKKQKEGLGPDVAGKMKSVEDSLTSAEGELQELLVESGKITQEAAQLKEAKETNEQLKEERETLVHEQTEWEFLERAFGANGIQALELEAAAPDVADITNRILESAYGDKFKISFQTLRKGSTGAYIEVFDILVENTETSVTRPLEWVSGGEGTWIKEALYHAFSIIRSRSQSAGFRTRFLDETDGALDHDSKLKYLKMIETVHEEGGADKTVLITHSQELKDIITQRIEL